MTNAITINGTNQTTTITGRGADLRCLVAVGRDVASVMRKHPGKPLPPAYQPHADRQGRFESPAARSRRMSQHSAWPRTAAEAPAALAALELPAAAWASLVISRALSV
jgi:hypothetical protein